MVIRTNDRTRDGNFFLSFLFVDFNVNVVAACVLICYCFRCSYYLMLQEIVVLILQLIATVVVFFKNASVVPIA